jgi:ribose-phosphate pyrophosphokinase
MTRAVILNNDLKKSFLAHKEDLALIEFDKFVFNGGESHIRIKEDLDYLTSNTDAVVFVTKLKTAQDITDLAIAVDAIDNLGSGASFHLLLGYLPGGRQDRVCNPGEALSSKVYANLINSIADWDSIQFIDAHSDVMPALLNNSYSVDNKLFVDKAIEALDLDDITLISPDAGANKKVLSLAQHLIETSNHSVEVVRADKNRDLATGNIVETIVYAHDLSDRDCVIVDDICDGGRTFIELAKVLKAKGARNVILIVTHGIFSKGFGPVLEYVDQIVTTNSFTDLDRQSEYQVTVIGLDETFYTTK